MKHSKLSSENLLSKDEQKKILGGYRNPDDDCPSGTHEFICITDGPDHPFNPLNLIYTRYCVSDGQPNPPCNGPS